jgi:hypothetical protein
MNDNVRIIEKPDLSDAELNHLFSASWTAHTVRAFAPILQRSLTYFGAYQDSRLIGFVNVAWDGGATRLCSIRQCCPPIGVVVLASLWSRLPSKHPQLLAPNGFTSTMTQPWTASTAGQDSCRRTQG